LTIFCNHKKLKKSEVILSYKEDKVFLRGTPAGVGMIGPETYVMSTFLFLFIAELIFNCIPFRYLPNACMGRKVKDRRRKEI
jgi:hypothetical protein